MAFEFGETTNQNRCIYLDNHQYNLNFTSKSGKQHYRCITSNCSSVVHIFNNLITNTPKPHNHLDDHSSKITRRKLIAECKEEIRSNPLNCPRGVYLDQVNKSDQQISLPTFKSIDSTLYRARNEKITSPPKSMSEIDLEKFRVTSKGEQFLQGEAVIGNDRILVYGLNEMFEKLCTSEEVLSDGTFYSAPQMFYQLYVFHFVTVDFSTPAIYALLPNKQKETYKILLNILKRMAIVRNLEFKPLRYIVDFESGMIEAIKEELPRTRVSGCLFHLNQSIFRNLSDKGLREMYNSDQTFRMKIRKLMALPFLNRESIVDRYREIINELISTESNHQRNNIILFLNYFTTTYINHDAKFPIELWCQYKTKIRTINNAEGWNHSINTTLSRAHPNIYHLLMSLERDSTLNQINYRNYLETNQPPNYKRKKYLKMNNKIDEYYKLLDEEKIDEVRFLTLVSHLLADN